MLSRLFTELHIPTFLLTNGVMELEQIMNDKKQPYYCKYASMDEYLHDHEELYELDEADTYSPWKRADATPRR